MIDDINYKERLFFLKQKKFPTQLKLTKSMYLDLCQELGVTETTYYHGMKIMLEPNLDFIVCE
jgi:hypothetical protein